MLNFEELKLYKQYLNTIQAFLDNCFENQKEYEYEIQIIDSTYSIEYQYSKSNLEYT